MEIKLHEITVGEVTKNYVDKKDKGVRGYDGKLDIRPIYQREFVYDEKKRNAVIDTIRKDFPLNVMYWVKNEGGNFEVLDGQQRTISFCQYVNNEFSIDDKYFHNLTPPEKDKILKYKLMVYFCQGNDQEKLDWFQVINIAGEKLTDQELRNAVYTGPWLTSAKEKFSQSNCAAYLLSKDYVNGSPIRQEILETALSWISNCKIEKYMSSHQHDQNANELWIYFKNVIDWVKLNFTTYRREMKGIDWGSLYNEFKDKLLDTDKLEAEIQTLMLDEDVTSKKGIYPYVLTRKEKYLNIRTFTANQKREAYEKQKGICPVCVARGEAKVQYELEEMEADHINPWSKGGKTNTENCQMLCLRHNREKSGK